MKNLLLFQRVTKFKNLTDNYILCGIRISSPVSKIRERIMSSENALIVYILIIVFSLLIIGIIIFCLIHRLSPKTRPRRNQVCERIIHAKKRRQRSRRSSTKSSSDTAVNEIPYKQGREQAFSGENFSHSIINEQNSNSKSIELKHRKPSVDKACYQPLNNESICNTTIGSDPGDTQNTCNNDQRSLNPNGRHVSIRNKNREQFQMINNSRNNSVPPLDGIQQKRLSSPGIITPVDSLIRLEDGKYYDKTTTGNLKNFPDTSFYKNKSIENEKRSLPLWNITEKVLELIRQLGKENVGTEGNYLNRKFRPPRPKQPESPLKSEEIIAILLGESGVGKSTFINALVNYLYFSSLDTALENERLVVLPISFILTEGYDLQEKIVSFGDPNTNENHNSDGQSVTQECRSYVFRIGNKRIRIIDTPGIGDTRGIEQDQRNIRNILHYINGLPHLNAICMLFKPDKPRLDIVTRLYFNELITFLGPEVIKNVFYCFTNTRPTFYGPGSTGALIRKMIEGLPAPYNEMVYNKTTIFCFDSEALRFLIALTNGIHFSDEDRIEYRKSWEKSSGQANRFLEAISRDKIPLKREKWSSLENCLFLIDRYARPLTEWFHYICRLSVLYDSGTEKNSIKFYCESLLHPIEVIRHCNSRQTDSQELVIAEYSQGATDRFDASHQCGTLKLCMIEYEIHCSVEKPNTKSNSEDITTQLKDFLELAGLLIQIRRQLKVKGIDRPDYFLLAVIDAAEEEEYIYSQNSIRKLNEKICMCLKQLKEQYEKAVKLDTEEILETSLISLIYRFLDKVQHVEILAKQMEALEKTYANIIESSTTIVPINKNLESSV